MLASFLMGLVGGQRGMMPLATVAVAAAQNRLPPHSGAPPSLGHPAIVAATVALAAAELAGDKMKSAPNRTIAIGLATRFMTSAIAGGLLAPRRQRWLAAALGGTTAVLASHLGLRARLAAISRHGQVSTGLVEDAVVLIGAIAILRNLERLSGRQGF
ncbi:hypothetical protein ACFOD4_01915 [Pseudoroseomonas globiformis]|uniref:DUF4126 domain-containing protein n=1 Tax=Teichococcus globiformis TaxID=2307229 RepID=A0ABV7FX11_9PROT